MVIIYVYALLATFAVSLVSLVGLFTISLKETTIKRFIFIFISLAVGSLLGDAFLHIIPKSFAMASSPVLPGLLIITGIVVFFAIEKFFHWHHHGDDDGQPHIHPVGNLVLFSDGLHNLLDGIIIGVSFLASIPLGVATTIAVILHEIPQEIGDFSVLLHAGYSRKKALWFNFLSALAAIAGTLIAFWMGASGEQFVAWVLPLAAGGFIYIAVADLIPELHKTKQTYHSIPQIIAVVFGVMVMLSLMFIE